MPGLYDLVGLLRQTAVSQLETFLRACFAATTTDPEALKDPSAAEGAEWLREIPGDSSSAAAAAASSRMRFFGVGRSSGFSCRSDGGGNDGPSIYNVESWNL